MLPPRIEIRSYESRYDIPLMVPPVTFRPAGLAKSVVQPTFITRISSTFIPATAGDLEAVDGGHAPHGPPPDTNSPRARLRAPEAAKSSINVCPWSVASC